MARPLSPAARALRRRLLVAGALVAALLALLVATCAREPHREEIGLAAPPALAGVAQGLAAEFEAAYPDVEVVLTPDTALARRVEGGVDVLLGHDAAWLGALAAQGRLRQPPQVLFGDHLVVVGRARSFRLDSLPQLRGIGRVAVPDTASTAAGRHAKAGLKRAGLWEALRRRLILAESPRAALAAVREGSVSVAVVHASDTLGAEGVGLLLDWPLALEPPIRVAVAVPRSAPHPDRALEFAEFARQPERAALWRRYGFSPLAEPIAP